MTKLTKLERQSMRVAKLLVKALREIEAYQGDPEDILDDAVIEMASIRKANVPLNSGPADTLLALRSHYLGGEWK